MAIQNRHTDISVTEFKHRCLEIIRRVEESGKPVAITRGGKVVARLNPSASSIGPGRLKPWVWWLTPDSPLPRVEREALDVKADRRELFMSAISLWEVQVLYARKRLDLPCPSLTGLRARPMTG